VEYLLSPTHPIGKSKSRFFLGHGFSEENVADLEQRLLAVARDGPVASVVSSPHGIKYVVDGTVATPAGPSVMLRTVWIIETGDVYPRFITAYPV
jgi:hypothetical protein